MVRVKAAAMMKRTMMGMTTHVIGVFPNRPPPSLLSVSVSVSAMVGMVYVNGVSYVSLLSTPSN